MIFYIEDELEFPPVDLANEDGLLCFGGDLKPERLILAYSNGIFPWADDPVLWFSPDPRMIIDLKNWKPSKSLKRTLKKNEFEIKVDCEFEQVMRACADTRDSTWISEDFLNNYLELHNQGFAHSFEVWKDNQLVGGLYGISLGNAFFGESMFHRTTDASKVAFSHLIYFMKFHKFELLDCQISNPHLISLGGIDVSRDEYISQLKKALKKETKKGEWQFLLDEYLNNDND
jgi:leucyl/phenylalanyl-tRNA---protein transferase